MDIQQLRTETNERIDELNKSINDFHGSLALARAYESKLKQESIDTRRLSKCGLVLTFGLIFYVWSR